MTVVSSTNPDASPLTGDIALDVLQELSEPVVPDLRDTVQLPESNRDSMGLVRWSQRHKPSRRLQESVEQGFLCKSSVLEDIEGDDEYHIQLMMDDPIAFAAKTSNPNTLQADQALKGTRPKTVFCGYGGRGDGSPQQSSLEGGA